MSQKHLVIIDGFSFLFRAYHAVRMLNRSDGLPTNALYGFSQMMIKVVKDLKPDLCCVALESIGPTFRKELYPDYKAHRTEMDEDMKVQLPYYEPLIDAFDVTPIRAEGFEADDVIATLADQYAATHKITIVSSDKDLMQLLGGNVSMLDTMKSKTYGPEEVKEKFGVGPDKVIEVQALIGDSSDNIPGVPGIGPKTAAQLISRFGSLENLYENLDQVEREKLRVSLVKNQENATLSKQLVTLKRDLKLEVSEDLLQLSTDVAKAQQMLEKLEFFSLAKRFATQNGQQKADSKSENNNKNKEIKEDSANYETITTLEQLQKWCKKLDQAEAFAFDTETDSLDPHQAKLVGISISCEAGSAAYIPLTHTTQQGDLLADIPSPETPKQLDKSIVFEHLTPLLSKPSLTKVAHNAKFDLEVLATASFDVTQIQNLQDTMIMSFCLDGGKHNHALDDLSQRHLNHQMIPYKEVCGSGKSAITFDLVPIDAATQYAAEDADVTLRLYTLFKSRLDKNNVERVKQLCDTVETSLIQTLVAMERTGILVDRSQLEKLSLDFAEGIAKHEKKIHDLAGTTFNVNSPKQLSEILFDQMGLQLKGKTPKSTNVAVLEALADDGPEIGNQIATEVIAFRQLSKLKSTYTEALIQQINPKTGRVHTSYNQTGAATGRFSSSDPNLQNIPIRTENGRKIRRAFIAAPGHVLLAADYSQVELRFLAHFSGSEGLLKAFNDDRDIHQFTAHQIFDVPLEDVSKDQRRIAKTINFGLVYGMGAVSLAKQIGTSRAEAADYIDRYFTRYSGIRELMDQNIQFARENGYVETLMGRRVHLPEINGKNPGLKAGAERAAINAPLQGSNADIIKKVMPQIHNTLQDKGFRTQMLLQVHDELVFEAPEEEVADVTPLIKSLMENVVHLKVPLKVDTGVGANWEDAH